MRNEARQPRQAGRETQDALTEYLAALEAIYPAAKGAAQISTRADKRVIVNILLPARARERMRLFDQMAEVGTRLLLETGQYIILSGH
ncbi:MAG: hypothetical protein HYR56_31050 [Acidobacteria bacterium]|nr:hypothetical protein [Acidobacteriota bacterium]MBI3424805.1 hypothetical protein [Acidobacteriota bacterium]